MVFKYIFMMKEKERERLKFEYEKWEIIFKNINKQKSISRVNSNTTNIDTTKEEGEKGERDVKWQLKGVQNNIIIIFFFKDNNNKI